MRQTAEQWGLWFVICAFLVAACGGGEKSHPADAGDAGTDAGLDAGDGGGSDDHTPPWWSAGAVLDAVDLGPTSLTLSWPAAEDNVGVTRYRIFQGERMLAAVTGSQNRYAVCGLALDTGYSLRVEAGDAAGNWSEGLEIEAHTTASLPSDPATTAPPLSGTEASSMASSVSFLYSGPDAVQTGVAAGSIKPRRVSVLRGKAVDEDAQPLAGVTVSLPAWPDLGRTVSREDGAYDLAINGGGLIQVRFEHPGRLPVQKQVRLGWNQTHRIDDIVMIPEDGHVTELQIGLPVAQTARAGEVSDADGVRTATVIMPAGTGAEMVLPDGSRQALSSASVRATEYTVGDSGPRRMPAGLPSNIAYTYAMELGLDEAQAAGNTEVRFDRPVFYYLENFLGFPAGIPVPTGYFDHERGVWVPSESGRVIAVLDTAGGTATVDTDGDGQADAAAVLDALGFTDEELARLAELYEAGDTLWRVPIEHFSTWDCNWNFYPPADAKIPWFKPNAKPKPDPCKQGGSVIDCHNMTLGEDINLAGVPFGLHYRSGRTGGDLNSLAVSLRDADAPESLKGILVEVDIAGQHHEYSFDSDPYPETEDDILPFAWDGKDGWGRDTNGGQPIGVSIGYVYDGVYDETNRFGDMGNADAITGSETRQEVALWTKWEGILGGLRVKSLGPEGWSMSVHHVYDPAAKELYLGSGQKRGASNLGAIVMTVAGTGEIDPNPLGGDMDGRVAVETPLGLVYDFDIAPDGSLLIVDAYRGVYRLTTDGILRRVAGGGTRDEGGIPATDMLIFPIAAEAGPNGDFYVTDTDRIWWVDPAGIGHTVAGGGDEPQADRRVPALEAEISAMKIELANDGSLYLLESTKCAIRRLTTDGMLAVVAGSYGVCGQISGDGGQAREATFGQLKDFAIGPDGSLYIIEFADFIVRRVAPTGVITTVAGNGEAIPSGDGGLALEAGLGLVLSIDVGPDGSLYLGSIDRIRRVAPDGIITTLAGGGDPALIDNLVPALRTGFGQVEKLRHGPDDNLYLFDQSPYWIRQVGTAYTGFSATGEIVIPAESGDELYVFDANGRHLRTVHTWSKAIIWEFDYDDDGRLATIRDADGDETLIERDADGHPLAIHPPEAPATMLDVDADGRLLGITDPAGGVHRFSYDAGGLMQTMTDPNDGEYQFEWNVEGKLIKNTDPAGGFVALDRVDQWLQDTFAVTTTTAMGRTAEYFVQRLGEGSDRLLNIFPDGLSVEAVFQRDESFWTVYPDGTRISVVQGPDPRFGMLAPVTSELVVETPGGLGQTLGIDREVEFGFVHEHYLLNDKAYTMDYEEAALTATLQSPTGRLRSWRLNGQGRLAEAALGTLDSRRLSYNSAGRVDSISWGSGADERLTTFGYDQNGYLTSVIDPEQRTFQVERDAAGRILRRILPDGREIVYGNDSNGNVTSVTPPGRSAHLLSYTPVDLIARHDPPDIGLADDVTVFGYNLDQQLISISRPGGAAVVLGYDSGARLSTVDHAFGRTAMGYDPDYGWVNSVETLDGIVLGYNQDGPLLLEETWSGPFSASVQRRYRDDFLVDRLTVAGTVLDYGYDDDRLLVSAGRLDMVRDENGLIEGSVLDGVSTASVNNKFGELVGFVAEHQGTTLMDVSYVRDKLGRITELSETIEGTTSHTSYLYDLAGRLEEVVRDGVTAATYQYDSNGNRLQADDDFGTASGSYDEQDRLLSYGAADYTWTDAGDLQGRTEGGQSTVYNYDDLGNLRSVTLPDTSSIEYVIDGLNRRIGKRVDGVLVQGFVYLDGLNPAAELDGNGDLVSVFVYGLKTNVPDYMIHSGVRYRILSDHLGSPRLVVDASSGAVAQRIDYDAFGRVLQDTNPGFQPFGCAGGIMDQHTGLVRMGARDYDFRTGRWTTRDPILFAGQAANLYGYVLMDPVNGLDPEGLKKKLAFGERLSNFAAGFGDTISFGLTSWIRGQMGIDGGVDPCSPQYQHGEIAGAIHGLASLPGTVKTVAGAGSVTVAESFSSFGKGVETSMDLATVGGSANQGASFFK
ncbi:MAG TPA: RHS repeat-associated core domain-containing protein [Myxococcota bacterium]|nr:RHS repeat-associated core domain-containing protein [Myxococcota bacterium]